MKTFDFDKKVFAVWKPSGVSSNKFIQELKKKFGFKKIGHGGTLDPLASGVLVVGVQEGTKKLSEVKNMKKEYVAIVKLGFKSLTDDAEGALEEIKINKKPEIEDIDKVIEKLCNKKEQIPPIFSAVKTKGVESYKLARKGIYLNLKPRPVKIYSVKVLKYEWPILKLKLVVGGGFYVRAFARDIGEELKTGAYLLELTRTAVGDFRRKSCINF